MKPLYFFILLVFAFSATLDAYAQVKAGTIIVRKHTESPDSIIGYDEEPIQTKQKSYLNQMAGMWTIHTMKRQARMDPENLNDYVFVIHPDSTFNVTTACGAHNGKFSLKGTSIKFNSINTKKENCDNQEQEEWFLKLLQNTVSRYSVADGTLYLRDGSSNIVFEGKKKR